jgi:DNA-binding transcriptional LysR family regulator
VAPDHKLAGLKTVSLRQLTAYPLICLPVGTGIRSVLDQACAAAGIRPTVALQATAPGAVMDLAARGLGVAVLSASMTAEHAGVRSVRVNDVKVPAKLALIWRKGDVGASRGLLPHCRAAFAA